MNKKGFSLVEVMAVVIILALLLLIAIPKVQDIIDEIDKQAYKESVELMVESANVSFQSASSKKSTELPLSYIFENNTQTNIENVGELLFKGDKPYSGEITVNESVKISVSDLISKNRKWCAVKDEDDKNVTVGRADDPEFNCIESEVIIPDEEPCVLELDESDNNIYYIDSVSDLYAFSNAVNEGNTFSGKKVILRNNLNMSDTSNKCGQTSFTPIGTNGKPFAGTFDGNTKSINNLTINLPNQDYVGLFGYNSGTIKGLNIKDANITGNSNVGGIAGYNSGTIKELVINAHVVGKSGMNGGIVGKNEYGSILSVILDINVEGTGYYSGGAIGFQRLGSFNGGIIENATVTNGNLIYGGYYGGGASDYNPEINVYYLPGVSSSGAQGMELLKDSKNDINAYEDALDTWIGGDDDDSGYYFDYNKKGKIVLKSVSNDPITFTLSGSGTSADPYIIDNHQHWKEATTKAKLTDTYYKLTNDIDFKNKKFYMFGSYKNNFNGIFEGGASTIKNVKMYGADYVGLFGYSNGKITGLTTDSTNINGLSYVGGITSYNTASGKLNELIIKNLSISATAKAIGGVAAYSTGNINGIIIDVNNVGMPTGTTYSGLIAGGHDHSAISSTVVKSASTSACMAFSHAYYTTDSYLYYIDGVSASSYVNATVDVMVKNAANDINAYESAGFDTWIGGDDDDSGYYFDYDDSWNIVIKDVKKDPITFTLEGSGTSADPYIIDNYQHWKEATTKADLTDTYYKLTENIDFKDNKYYMLGSYFNHFNGTFDGNGKILYNPSIYGDRYIGMSGYNAGIIRGVNIKNINILANGTIGGIAGYNDNGGNIYDVTVRGNLSDKGTDKYYNLGGIVGYGNVYSAISNAIVNVNLSSYNSGSAGGILGSFYKASKLFFSNTLIEGSSIDGATSNHTTSYGSYNTQSYVYYVEGTTATGYYGTEISKDNANLYYYETLKDSSKKPIFETRDTGDVNNTGYFFEYDSNNDIIAVKAYTYTPPTTDPSSETPYVYINPGAPDQNPPTCTLISMTILTNGFRPLVTCTDDTEVSSFRSYFDSTTDKASQTYEQIGNNKTNITGTTTEKTYNGTWAETNRVGPWPRSGPCYYFRYGAMDSSGNYCTYVTKECYSY